MQSKWTAPANIALIKYWGKQAVQIPANPSLSMTLSRARTVTEVKVGNGKPGSWSYTYAGQPKPGFEPKLVAFFDRIRDLLPLISKHELQINSENNFPHSSGISSSASFHASLALCLMDLNQQLGYSDLNETAFRQQSSAIARLGSGSAARSVYGSWVVWGQSELSGSNNQYAIPFPDTVHPIFDRYRDAVLIVSSEAKPLSSTAGHALMDTNPFAPTRYEQARNHLKQLIQVMTTGDITRFIDIVEQEAMSLHGLIMNSRGGTILMKPHTLELISRIRRYRSETGSSLCFTLDAGPNVHLLYPDQEKEPIRSFIRSECLQFCENEKWLDDYIGNGAERIN